MLVVPSNSRFATAGDIVKEAKQNPGKLSYCSSGNGTSQHIIGEMFKRKAGVDILHVPYRGTAAAITDLIAGVCDMMFDGMGTSAPQIEGKKLKALFDDNKEVAALSGNSDDRGGGWTGAGCLDLVRIVGSSKHSSGPDGEATHSGSRSLDAARSASRLGRPRSGRA